MGLIGKGLGTVTGKIVDIESAGVFTSPLNKLWRAKILLNRATSPMPKGEARVISKVNDIQNQHYARESSLSLAQAKDPWTCRKRASMTTGVDINFPVDHTEFNTKTEELITSDILQNQIIIFNYNVSPYQAIRLQNRPDSIDVNPQSNWVAVKSMGRNNPFMMYTGGEDTISLEISWFANDAQNRQEVVTKCRLLESWTRADGYVASPPVLKIKWGTSGLFDNDTFILESAPYRLYNMQSAARASRYQHNEWGSRNLAIGEEAVNLGLVPQCATQTLTFKRVTAENRTHAQIVSVEELQKTKGILINN